jgi:hypothetical protein
MTTEDTLHSPLATASATHDAASVGANPSAQTLLALFERPAVLGRLASASRREHVGDEVLVRRRPEGAEAPTDDVLAVIERGDTTMSVASWPSATELQPGDHVTLWVEPEQRPAFATWLATQGATLPAGVFVAPVSRTPTGTHRTWLVGALRIVLGPGRHVVARHDLLGPRVAQITLGFGASVLEGPWRADRRLPVAGVTRPDENTPIGLSALVEQAGLVPRLDEARHA